MIHVRPFGLQCSEAMSVHARLVKFNPSIPHVQNCLAPVVCERRNLSHPIITWCFETTNLRNGAQLGGTLSWNYYEGSSYLSYRRSKQIRCKNMINITCNHIVTWYGQYHHAPLISIFGAPWSSSSPAWHHDLHHCVFMKSSRQRLLLLLWLTRLATK